VITALPPFGVISQGSLQAVACICFDVSSHFIKWPFVFCVRFSEWLFDGREDNAPVPAVRTRPLDGSNCGSVLSGVGCALSWISVGPTAAALLPIAFMSNTKALAWRAWERGLFPRGWAVTVADRLAVANSQYTIHNSQYTIDNGQPTPANRQHATTTKAQSQWAA
jgi:hypothetical protein